MTPYDQRPPGKATHTSEPVCVTQQGRPANIDHHRLCSSPDRPDTAIASGKQMQTSGETYGSVFYLDNMISVTLRTFRPHRVLRSFVLWCWLQKYPAPVSMWLKLKPKLFAIIWHINTDKQRVLMHRHQRWNVRHGLCHIYMRYIYIWVYSFCLFCCLFIIVTWWYIWCIVWQVASKRKYRHVW